MVKIRAVILAIIIGTLGQATLGAANAQEQQTIPAPTPTLPKADTPNVEPDDEEMQEHSLDVAPPSPEGALASTPKPNKDLTVRSEAGRQTMLAELFETLKSAPDADAAELTAEEIWAVFLQSESASIDFTLLRGISAHSSKNYGLARRLFDHVLRLQPKFAEGWSRSGRLAYDQGDLNQAVDHITQCLKLEPRHFFALWTLGNILEKLERPDEAFEAYSEAYKLYPEHAEIKARVEALEKSAIGQAL